MHLYNLLYQICTYHIAGATKHINTDQDYIIRLHKITTDYHIILYSSETNNELHSQIEGELSHDSYFVSNDCQNPLELWDLAQEQRIKARSDRKWEKLLWLGRVGGRLKMDYDGLHLRALKKGK